MAVDSLEADAGVWGELAFSLQGAEIRRSDGTARAPSSAQERDGKASESRTSQRKMVVEEVREKGRGGGRFCRRGCLAGKVRVNRAWMETPFLMVDVLWEARRGNTGRLT